MKMIVRSRIIVGFTLAVAALSMGASAADPAKTTASGVYSAAQAVEGAELYQGSCASCHGAALGGSMEVPPLQGKFVANWAGAPASELFDYISRAMPLYAPGSLSPEDNAKIVAYLLKANGMPAGNVPLPSDMATLGRIKVDVARAYKPAPQAK
jgi:mono/diheme cytochrome c family protein